MTLSNKKPFIAGNWKMFKTITEALELVKEIRLAEEETSSSKIVVIPPYTALSKIQDLIHDSAIQLGAQNIFWEEEGAFTGEISAAMLKDAGCNYVVIGHSERRQYFGETNATVNKKIKSALKHDLFPIMCIGESLEERDSGKTIDKVEKQINEGLEGIGPEEAEKIIIAYEPLWAIGTGLTASPEQAQDIHSYIRSKLTEKYGNKTGSCAIILYGGSVKPANAFSLLKEKDINGALIGGAALKSESFIEIAKEAIKAYEGK